MSALKSCLLHCVPIMGLKAFGDMTLAPDEIFGPLKADFRQFKVINRAKNKKDSTKI